VILATGPFPFYYGYGPADAPGPADPLLPTYGMSLQGFEQAPPGIFMQLNTNQTILHSVPQQFPFPPGDARLRAVNRLTVSSLNRYQPFIEAVDPQGTYYGDAALFLAFGTGPAKGGRILYVWDTLLSGPQGLAIMEDTVTWIVNAVLHPPPARFDFVQLPDPNHVLLGFIANSNLDYTLQYKNALDSGIWSNWQELRSAPTNRSVQLLIPVSAASSRFYRLAVGP